MEREKKKGYLRRERRQGLLELRSPARARFRGGATVVILLVKNKIEKQNKRHSLPVIGFSNSGRNHFAVLPE